MNNITKEPGKLIGMAQNLFRHPTLMIKTMETFPSQKI